jgi:hypothetical protein
MTEQGLEFTTCPHCRHDTDIPTGFIVAWVKQSCSSCSTPHIAPKAFSRVEVCDVLTNESVFDMEQASRDISDAKRFARKVHNALGVDDGDCIVTAIRKQRQRIEHLENQLHDVIKANTTERK